MIRPPAKRHTSKSPKGHAGLAAVAYASSFQLASIGGPTRRFVSSLPEGMGKADWPLCPSPSLSLSLSLSTCPYVCAPEWAGKVPGACPVKQHMMQHRLGRAEGQRNEHKKCPRDIEEKRENRKQSASQYLPIFCPGFPRT